MVCGIGLSNEFSQEIGALNLDVFHIRNFIYHTDLAKDEFFDYCNSLKTLYIVHPDDNEDVSPPDELKKLVIYCPKSNKVIGRCVMGLNINVEKCHVLREV